SGTGHGSSSAREGTPAFYPPAPASGPLPPASPAERPFPAGIIVAMPRSHDVLIVGGGLVGASLAIALDRAGIDVALLEATPGGAMPAVFDQRNLSFADTTVNALDALGVLQKLRAPPGDIRRIHVSRAGDFGSVRLDAGDYG